MKLCPKCHTENSTDANFCDKCQYKFPASPPPSKLCPAGKHPMDPAWSSCPYCKAAQGKAADRVEIATVGDEEISAEAKRKTAFAGAETLPRAAAVPAPYVTGRRIVGLLVTYSARREGLIFPVYEGRNYLGSDPDCEICLSSDDQISGKHAAIFYRGAGFEICDEKSLNGTWMNGRAASLRGEPLANYAEFKTGATVWKFIAVEPAPTE